MADYYQGGRSMMYSGADDCYEAGRQHGHGNTRVHSHTDDYYYNGGAGAVDDDCGIRRAPPPAYGRNDCGGHGGGKPAAAVYSEEYYKKEEREHKNRERLGEVGALASGAFALYEGQRAKKDPANAQRHRIEQGVAAVAALGAGGYAYREHHLQKEATYGGAAKTRVPQPQHGCY